MSILFLGDFHANAVHELSVITKKPTSSTIRRWPAATSPSCASWATTSQSMECWKICRKPI